MVTSRIDQSHCPGCRRLILIALLIVSPAAVADAIYDVSVTADLNTLSVEAHFTAPLPEVLEAGDDSAGNYLRALHIAGQSVPIPEQLNRGISLTPSAATVEYTVDLHAIARAERLRRRPPAGLHAALLSPDLWLWLPPQHDGQSVTLRFHLPQGMSVSAPWPSLPGNNEFQSGAAPTDWPAMIAIGRFNVETVAVPGAALRLAVLDGSPAPDRAMLRAWVAEGATAVAGLYGKFPLASPQILIVPLGKGDEPVPWGQVLRGGGAAAQLFIDQTRTPEEFRGDWVLVHELSHMLHPNLRKDGAWLAEGMATYYQNVLRARAGMLTEQQAWQKLQEGFARGVAKTEAGMSLNDATQNMMEKHLFMRVYWSGAAIVLLADLDLHRAGQSLDLVLAKFRDCCLAEPRIWPVAEFLQKLDSLSGTAAFMPLYRRYADSDQFPDLAAAYAALGLTVADGHVALDRRPDAVLLRRAIMGSATK